MALSLESGTRAESAEAASAKSCCFQSHKVCFAALFDLMSDAFSASSDSMSFCCFTYLTLSATNAPTRATFITVLLLTALVAALTTLFANSISGTTERTSRRL
ncbi:hypothetical protein FF1_038207 [Malus domestica]